MLNAMKIPNFIEKIIKTFKQNSFEAYLVGGCVRDLLMGKEPGDWDMTTNARPEKMLKIFSDSKYENEFGTVLIKIKNKKNETEHVIEATTYRSEGAYSDRRHPDDIQFETELDKDLERRDFTINAMAMTKVIEPKIKDWDIIDLFGGQKDIKLKIIRAVGEPIDRFREDALRMMRAVRFSCQLGFSIEPKTERGILKMAGSIRFIANERIHDELVKILKTDRAYEGIMKLHELKLLQYIIPELEQGRGVPQNHHHIYSVFKHNILSLKNCPSKDWRVKLASLLHDIGKVKARKIIKGQTTFYNHEYIGERMTRKIMTRLKFSKEDMEKVTNLVRNHMFYYDADEVTASSVRRLVVKVGEGNLKDLIDIRIADRLGSGTPKGKPYKLRHLEYMMKKVQSDPISVKMLKINGEDLMKLLNIVPSPKIGTILDVLLSEVIEDPKLNTKEYLENRSRELNDLNADDLRQKAKEIIARERAEDDQKMKEEFWVK